MFTGIVECTGVLQSAEPEGSNLHWWVASPVSDLLRVDQSVAHDGVCLTVTDLRPGTHAVTLVAETLTRSHLGRKKPGDRLNIERSLTLAKPLDGHMVQGHVDDIVTCIERRDEGGSWLFRFRFDPAHAPLLIDKGSVCLNGVSLTVIQPGRDTFSVTVIPYTLAHTTFGDLQPGMTCNVEFDLVAKYLLRWSELGQQSGPSPS